LPLTVTTAAGTPLGTVKVTDGAGVVVVAAVVAVVGTPNGDDVVGVVGVAVVAALAAAALPAGEAPAVVVVEEPDWAGFGIGLKAVPGANSEKPCSWPGPADATATTPRVEVVVVDPGVPGVVDVAVDVAGAEELEPPLIIFSSFGPWITAMPRNATPRTTAAIRARRSRIWAGLGRFAAISLRSQLSS
jgi:hypothetical protein